MKIYAEGNSMVYEISLENILKAEVTDEMIDGVEQELYAQKENIKTSMKLIRTGVPSLESIIYKYCDKNGKLIYEIEFDDERLETVETPVKPGIPAEPETKTNTSVISEKSELEEYLEANAKDIRELEEGLSAEGMEMKIVAEGNSLVYECTITAISQKDVTDEVVDAMQTEMTAQEETLKSALEMIRTEVPSTESIICRYYDKDGNLIYDAEVK